jgi:hypothetical protein
MDAPEGGGGIRPVAVLALLGALAGCVGPGFDRGFSGREQEWARGHSAGDFSIVTADHSRAIVSALGNRIAIEPADGFCLASEAIETSDRSAFILLGDCALEDPDGFPAGEGPLDLPPGVPGIMTVSISGDPGFSRQGAEAETLADLQAFLESEEGRELLGRGGDGDGVSVVETRRIGDILYVLVEDPDGRVPVLAPRFWRAFVELNDRLAVVTVSGFRDRPLPEDEMLRYLGDQVRQLEVANSEPLNDVVVEVAERSGIAADARASGAPEALSSLARDKGDRQIRRASEVGSGPAPVPDLRPTSVIVATEEGEEFFWPVPQSRGAGAAGQGGPAPGEAERIATVNLAPDHSGRRDIGADAAAPATAPEVTPRR